MNCFCLFQSPYSFQHVLHVYSGHILMNSLLSAVTCRCRLHMGLCDIEQSTSLMSRDIKNIWASEECEICIQYLFVLMAYCSLPLFFLLWPRYPRVNSLMLKQETETFAFSVLLPRFPSRVLPCSRGWDKMDDRNDGVRVGENKFISKWV